MRPLVVLAVLLAAAGCRTTALPPPPEPVTVEEEPGAVEEETPVEPPMRIAEEVPADKPPPPDVPPGVYESRSHYPQAGVTEWRLTSGVRLGFKPSPDEPRRVRFLVSAPGGLRAVPDSLAAGVFAEADASALFSLHMTGEDTVLEGAAATRDLSDALRAMAEMLGEPPRARGRVSLTAERALTLLLAGTPFALTGAPGGDGLGYARLLSDPRNLLVVVVGDAAPAEVERAAAAFVRLRPSFRDLVADSTSVPPPRVPRRSTELILPAHAEGAGAIGFRGTVTADYDARAGLEVLGHRLAEEVSDRIGAPVRHEVALDFPSGVAEVRLLVDEAVDGERFRDAVLREANALRTGTVGESDLARSRAAARAAHEALLGTNEGWAAWLTRLLRFDHDTREALAFGRRLSGVPADRVRTLALAVLDPDRYVLVVQPAE